MKKIKKFIDKNPHSTDITLGVIGLIVAGFIYYDFEIMFKILIGVAVFGVLIGLIFFLIRILFR